MNTGGTPPGSRRDRLSELVAAVRRAIARRHVAPETRRLITDDIKGTLSAPIRVVNSRRSMSARPVPPQEADLPAPIDAVVTWVNHSDPEWQDRYRAAVQAATDDAYPDPSAYHVARFEDHDELRFALRSLWEYAPWFRRVVIVTAGQTPPWLDQHDRVRVVTHQELLPSAVLPTFNSHAIEASLHRIAGLSEQFVYLNDDFFFARPVSPDLFFEPSTGRPRVFTSTALIPPESRTAAGQYAAAHRTDAIVRDLTSRPAPWLLAHAPYPQRLSTIVSLERQLPEEFALTSGHRFRHPEDISVPASLGPWYALNSGLAVAGHLSVEYVSVGHPMTGARLRRLRRFRHFDTFCLNWTEATPSRWNDAVQRFLVRRFPSPAPWERGA